MTNDAKTGIPEAVQDGLVAPHPGKGLPSQEQWDEWQRTTQGIQLHPDARSQVPELLQDIKEFRELGLARQRLFDSAQRIRDEHGALVARNEARRLAHEADVRRATLEGTEFPPKPVYEEWLGLEHDAQLFNRHHAILEAVERQLLHDRAEDWGDHLRKLGRPAHVKAAKAREAMVQAEEVLRPFKEAREQLDRVVSAVAARSKNPTAAANVAGMDPSVEVRIVRRRQSDILAEQQVVEDFLESRVQANRKSPLSGRR